MLDNDEFYDIEEELLWEATQRKVVERVKLSEEKGWGYTTFKNYLLDKYPSYRWEEEILVKDFQIYLLQNTYNNVPEWADFHYGKD